MADARKFCDAEDVERKTDPVLDSKFLDTKAVGRKTDPILDPNFSDDISVCFTFNLSGVTFAEFGLEDISSRSSETRFKADSKVSKSEISISFELPFSPLLLALSAFAIFLVISLITLYIGRTRLIHGKKDQGVARFTLVPRCSSQISPKLSFRLKFLSHKIWYCSYPSPFSSNIIPPKTHPPLHMPSLILPIGGIH